MFTVLGLVGTVAGLVATVRNVRAWRRAPGQPSLFAAVAAVAGVALAIGCYRAMWAYDDRHRIWGFPLVAAVFQKDGEQWFDYVGPLTFPFAVGNAVFGLLLPQLVVRAVRRLRAPA